MLLQFANGRSQLPSPTVVASSGGTTTVSQTLYFALQGLNASGYNLLSAIVGPVTIGVGQQATITLPTTVHAPGEFFGDYVISASTTNTASSFVQVARISAFSAGSPIALPATLTLSTDAQLTLSAIVANPAALPSAALVLGMRRGVSSLAYVFEYDSASTATANASTVLTASPAPGQWIRVGGFSTVVTSVTDPGGCGQDVRTLTEGSIAARPYNCNGQNGPGQRFWMVNDTTDAVPAGLRVMLAVSVGEAPASGLFEGMLRVIFRGYVLTTDGSVRTITAGGDNMRGVNQEIIFENKKTDLILEDDLQPGEAYAIDVYPNLRPEFLGNQISNKSLVRVSVALALQSGAYVEGGAAWGNRIFPDYDKGIVVPRKTGVKVLKRSGMVNSRAFLGVAESLVVGAQANTNQSLYINSNGSVYYKTEAQNSTEAIRAKVSTVAGVSTASAWSAPLTVVAGNALNVTCTYPSNGTVGAVRVNYPDFLLAGSNKGQFNPQLATLYIRSTVSTIATIKKYEGRLIVDGATQIFQVSDWSAGTVIASVPAAPSANFCLFEPVSAAVATSGVGSIPAGTVEVAFAYQFDGTQVSSISHDTVNGCLQTSTLNYAAVEQASQYWAAAVDTVANLRAILISQVIAYQSRYVSEVNNPYRYNPSSTAADDGYLVVKPAEKAVGDTGRWILDDSNAIYILTVVPVASAGEIGDIAVVINSASADHGKLFQKVTYNTWTLKGTVAGLQGNPGANGTNGLQGNPGSQGVPGATGSPGTVTAAGGLIIEATAALATTSTQLALRNASGVLLLRDSSSGYECAIATLDKTQAYTKAQRSTPVVLTDAASIAIDASLANLYTVTLAGNRVLANPTNLQPGSNFEIRLTQDATGTRTLTYGTAYKFVGAVPPTLSTAVNAIDILSCRSYDGSSLQCDLGKGYA